MGTRQAKEQHSFRTLGLSIDFPFSPYGTQRAMMNKLTSILCNKEHALIESPTGTGKTLVLLCSALAWQSKSKDLNQPFISARLREKQKTERLEKLRNRECTCGRAESLEHECKKMKKGSNCDDVGDMCRRCLAVEAEEKFQELSEVSEVSGDIVGKVTARIPRIYYGTRTHKQITQVVRELNKTSYSENLRMCILSSRERTCINDDVNSYSDRNERCQDLIANNSNKKKKDLPTCPFYHDSNQLKSLYETINDEFKQEAWDIEQLTDFGRKIRCCPYFGVRKLQEEADITFCPYNYLLDPTIRNNLDINIKDSIVIIDEAHNLEDICRDSASFIIDTKQIENIIDTINLASNSYIQGSPIMDAYTFFREKFNRLKFFLAKFNFGPQDKDSFDESERKILSNEQMLNELKNMELGPANIAEIKNNLKILKGDDDEQDDKRSTDDTADAALNTNQLQSIKQLTITLDFMYSEPKSILDFRAVVTKHLDRDYSRFPAKRNAEQSTSDPVYIWQLSILCMNPSIAFDKIHKSAWSVIVASGTLSPIESLKTELGCTFSSPFEGGHVISHDRICASIVSIGPNKVDLNCSYNNSMKLNFQDEVGYVVRDVCKIVPKGVLCFFPSYERMETFCERWTGKGILREIESYKGTILKEQKKLNASDFEKVLAKYNKRARGKGALLLAVFRGKVSEGIDFADDAARAVITIGIPYPNVREVSVGLKKQYNDLIRRVSPQIMTGNDWYACQAFRALNQALGRCIRHKEDWGSIIMIDSRLKHGYSNKNLSKWLRNNLLNTSDYSEITSSLKEFVSGKTKAIVEPKIPEIELIEPEIKQPKIEYVDLSTWDSPFSMD